MVPFQRTTLNQCLPQLELNLEKDIFVAASDESSFGQQGAYFSERWTYFDPTDTTVPPENWPF